MNAPDPPPSDPLEIAARDLAETCPPGDRPPAPLRALVGLAGMPRWLEQARRAAAGAHADAVKAAEWLLDNDYQVHRAILQIRQDMPPSFYRRLPAAAGGADAGTPRVFLLACGLLHASRLQVSGPVVVRYARAYQEVSALTIGELWALPTMLRLGCLEMLAAAYERLFPDVASPFGPAPGGGGRDGLFDDVETVARALANLGAISSIAWKDLFDRTSVVEAALRGDPSGFYPRMDFDTRDRYRKAVEELARGTSRSELEIADLALSKSARARSGDLARHVGHWLIGEGRGRIEADAGYRRGHVERLARALRGRAGALYAGALAAAGLTALALPVAYLSAAGAGPAAMALGIVLSVVPASILAVTVVHWVVTQVVPPRVLSKLDFEAAIGGDCTTVVAVPVLLASPAEVDGVMERLEMHRLSNPDPGLRFVLLSDLPDAARERAAGDDAVERALVAGIARLNARHAAAGTGPFLLLHRRRRFNAGEATWMGWERKRGKLHQFNRFLLGEDVADFVLRAGPCEGLRGTRFVVTADADTRLPHGSVARLAGTLAHPLNAARFDEATGSLVSGYTVVQPRVEIAPDSGSRSLFARLYTGDTAIDIYSRAVSDVYQDLFASGIFIGKGVYEVASFERTLEGRVPENALVSHDLFEGAHGRAALATDIVLYEGFPRGYVEYLRRWHRWVRGDWQLVPWLGARVPAAAGRRANALAPLERWKILDNMRRSLVPVSLLALAAAGWIVLPGNPWVWTGLTVAAPAAYLFTDLVSGLARGRRRGAVRSTVRRSLDHAGRWFLAIAFLAQEALVALDAIARTLWRMTATRRNLLQWTPAAHVARRFAPGSRADAWRHMWPASALSAVLGGAVAAVDPQALAPAAPLLALWAVSPEIAARIGRPRRARPDALEAGEQAWLRRLARRTWLYFETFAGPEDNWLPPDNVQEEPHAETAHRTSPTNVGMMFLSSLSAWDLGFIGSNELAARQRSALDALDRLDRYRGHLLNWYDTRTLKPLEPRYVSTVDSGNLAVSCLVLREGCREAARAPALRRQQWEGLVDAVGLLVEAATPAGGEEPPADVAAATRDLIAAAEAARDAPQTWPAAIGDMLDARYPALQSAISAMASQLAEGQGGRLREMRIWLERVRSHLAGMQRDLDTLCPWWRLFGAAPADHRALAGRLAATLPATLALDAADAACDRARASLDAALPRPREGWAGEMDAAIAAGHEAQRELRAALESVAARCDALADDMDFRFLFHADTRLFHIGYNVSSDRMDPHHYDLLATEARLASYFAIAKGDAPVEHWFCLGRPMTHAPAGPALVSWNGSMFEYLMPPLFMLSDAGTLIGQSERMAIDAQRRHAQDLDVPWGVSESAYASRDLEHRYRYRAFGVPELGLRRGLSRDLVVAPYATALALPIDRRAAMDNLRRLEGEGAGGRFGLFEALDYTPDRRAASGGPAPVRAFMAHHQGMALGAIANALCGGVHVRRFHADARMRALELLLHERIPWEFPPRAERGEEREVFPEDTPAVAAPQPWAPIHAAPFPQVHLLGNGRLSSWISEAGGGGLSWNAHALTRFRPDATRDCHGVWTYVRDDDSARVWSLSRQPTGVEPDEQEVVFHPHMAEFHRRDDGIGATMEVAVLPGDDIEVRRLTVVNQTPRHRSLTVTSAAEVGLAPPLADERHPAFSKLFVVSQHLPAARGLLFERRARSPAERPPVLLHRLVADEGDVDVVAWETDRRAFLGRTGTAALPAGIAGSLSGRAGATLDPVMALQVALALEPHGRREFALVTMAAGSREAVLELAERYATMATLNWAIADAATDAWRETRRLGLEARHLPVLQQIASLLIHPHAALRAGTATLRANGLGQPHLWAFGISGDRPILLVRTRGAGEGDLLPLLIRAHRYWRHRGLRVDLVVVRTGASGYVEPLRDAVARLSREAGAAELLARDGGIHLVFADHVGEDGVRMLEAAARVALDADGGALEAQVAAACRPRASSPVFVPTIHRRRDGEPPPQPRPSDLAFDNGIGGFSPDGRDYVIHLEPGQATPSAWANVMANDGFGAIATESGAGFSFAVNSGENRLTPWSNDPLADTPGEAIYLRDEESGAFWTPTPRPAGHDTACTIRHTAGATTWERQSHGLHQTLEVFVPPDDPVKVFRLRLRNMQPAPRRVTATCYVEWLLGALSSVAREHVVCDYDAARHAVLARNPWNPEFAARVAFLTSDCPPHSVTVDRQDFLGREGDPSDPAALSQWDLGQCLSSPSDPCGAFQVHLDIAPAGEAEVVFTLGQGADRDACDALIGRWQARGHAGRMLERTRDHWDRLLGAVRVRTPDPAFDVMANRWLPYQAMASRVLARAGFHQAGGAIGFRDQLQDVLALMIADPARTRAHILACAAHQFEEGDVLHWWHPPSDRGVRTRCSDDLLWLPHAAASYVLATGDRTILDEQVAFLRGAPLAEDEHDRYARFEVSRERRSLFEHCERALERGLTAGAHGLPLIGTGDWNDGMDRIGAGMRGESVWLAWFLLATIDRFAAVARRHGRDSAAERWLRRAKPLRRAVERAGWDGGWYRRAYDDNAQPWGSAANEECRIDLIAQAWAALSGAASPERAATAMEAATRRLVDVDARLVRLLWPPFDRTLRDPGYIRAYPPGIRENGGQYTHAAAWFGMACAALGDGDAAGRILGLINPLHRTRTPAECARYLGEPYVVAADVGGVAPHVGRAGWTWYTGSAAWAWRLGTEAVLGLRLVDGGLEISPCLPADWDGFEAEVRGAGGVVAVRVERAPAAQCGAGELLVDGARVAGRLVEFPAAGATRTAVLRLPPG